MSKQGSGSIYNNTSTNLNTNTNTVQNSLNYINTLNTNSNNNSNSNNNININSNNTIYNLNINNHLKNINININNHPSIFANTNSSSTKTPTIQGFKSNNSLDSNKADSIGKNNFNVSNSRYEKSDNIQINDLSFNNINNSLGGENTAANNSNFAANKMFQFKKEFLNINNKEDNVQLQLDMIIKQKLQKKKADSKNKSNFLNFTNPINHNTGTSSINHSSCKNNNNNNNSITANFESKQICYFY